MRPRKVAQLVWGVAIGILLGYEAWALWQGYEWTLTAGARELVDQNPWLGGVVAGAVGWLVWHILGERRKDGR